MGTMVNVTEFDGVPSGLTTITVAVPGFASKLAEIEAVSCDPENGTVVLVVIAVPFQ